MWELFGSYLLNSTANQAQFEWKWAGYFTKNPQTTIALTFLTHIISAIGGVRCNRENVDGLGLSSY